MRSDVLPLMPVTPSTTRLRRRGRPRLDDSPETWRDVLACGRLAMCGTPVAILARHYGVSASTIRRWARLARRWERDAQEGLGPS